MPELYVEPHVLADAGRSLAAERSVLSDVADALAPAFGVVTAALPGSRTAEVAGRDRGRPDDSGPIGRRGGARSARSRGRDSRPGLPGGRAGDRPPGSSATGGRPT